MGKSRRNVDKQIFFAEWKRQNNEINRTIESARGRGGADSLAGAAPALAKHPPQKHLAT